jgi:hypothetical protein
MDRRAHLYARLGQNPKIRLPRQSISVDHQVSEMEGQNAPRSGRPAPNCQTLNQVAQIPSWPAWERLAGPTLQPLKLKFTWKLPQPMKWHPR